MCAAAPRAAGEEVPHGATVDGSPARLYQGKLLMARQARKLVEQDELLLRNRIALLKVRRPASPAAPRAAAKPRPPKPHRVALTLARAAQQEEGKVWSKIDRTKKKASEIIQMRVANETKLAMRQAEEEKAVDAGSSAQMRYDEQKAKLDAVRMKRLVAAANERKRRVLDLKASKEAARQQIEKERMQAQIEAKVRACARSGRLQ